MCEGVKPLDVSIHCNDVFYCQQLAELCDPHSLRLASFRAEMCQSPEHLAIIKQVMLKYNIEDVRCSNFLGQGEEQEQEQEQEKIEPSITEWYD